MFEDTNILPVVILLAFTPLELTFVANTLLDVKFVTFTPLAFKLPVNFIFDVEISPDTYASP
ncbi:MAG: hypothetical protein EB078_09180, partial [Proteobacteria bacterium]|nr:hypothetical protein [Pseudomonadota bacterium]